MKKFLKIFALVILLLVVGLAFSYKLILKELIEKELTELNGAPVKIEKLDISLKNNEVYMKNIRINSNIDKGYTFILIPEFKSFYDIFLDEKLIVLEDAQINNMEFYFKKDSDDFLVFKDKLSDAEKNYERERAVSNLKQKYMLDLDFDFNVFEKQEDKIFSNVDQKLAKIKSKYTDDFKLIKTVLFENLDGQTFYNEKEIDVDKENNVNLKTAQADNVQIFIDKNKINIENIDKYIKSYLNSVYEERIYKKVIFFRNFLKEVRQRNNRTISANWQFYFKNITFNTNLYGINFYGELKGISTHIFKDNENLDFRFYGEKDDKTGEIKGQLNFSNFQGYSDILIPDFDLSQNFGKLVKTGESNMNQEISIDGDYIEIKGKIYFKNLNLDKTELIKVLNAEKENEVLKEFLLEVFDNIRRGKIEYLYNTDDRYLEIKTNISDTMSEYLIKNEASLKTKLEAKLNENQDKKDE